MAPENTYSRTLDRNLQGRPGGHTLSFVNAFKALPGLKVAFGEQSIRVYDGTAVNTGY
jgi:hypothetical protein